MPQIVALCPYCRAGGVRASDTAIGATATCPKCKSNFTIVPEEGHPALPEDVFKPAPKARSTEETRAAAALPDVTEPSPVLPAEPKPKAKPAAPTPAPAAEASEAPADTALVLGLGALILVGPAVLASQLPYGRVIALALAAAGLVGGVLAVLGEGRARLAGATAAVLHVVAVVVLLFLPSWLNLDPWTRAKKPDEPSAPLAVGHGTSTSAPADWVDAGTASWQFGDVRVTVRSATVGPPGARPKTGRDELQLTVRVANEGSERAIPLSGWAAGSGEGARLTDAAGRAVKFKADLRKEPPRPSNVFPGHSAEVTLSFDVAAGRPESYRLELAGVGVGVEHPIRFQLPATFVGSRQKP